MIPVRLLLLGGVALVLISLVVREEFKKRLTL